MSVIERREKEENNEKKKVEDWDLILKINDSLWDTFHRREKMRGEIYSTQEYPGVYIVKREISKEEGKYGPG
ncbi:MAG: hypothetical protein ACP5IZ_12015, partial [Thermoprotei archaeon]